MRALLVALVVLSVGTVEAAPPPRPAELMVAVAIDPPALAGVKAYADAVSPGAGGSFDLVRLLGVGGVPAAALDMKRPMYLLFAQLGGAPAFAVVGKIADDKTLGTARVPQKVAGGWAMLGAQNAIDALAPWALVALPAAPAPRATTITLYTARLGDVVQLFAKGSSGAADGLAKFQKVAGDTDQIDIHIEATVDLATVDIAAVPRAGTRLQQFAAAQRPSDFALAGKLPAMSTAMLAAGRIAAGSYRDELRDLAVDLFATGNTDKALHDAVAAIAGGASGDFALVASSDVKRGGTELALFGVADPKAVEAGFGAAATAVGKGLRLTGGKKPFETWTADTLRPYDGVALRGIKRKFDVATTPEEQRRLARKGPTGREDNAFGIIETPGEPTLGIHAAGPDGAGQAARMIDALRGKAPRLTLTRTTAQLVENARVRRDSVVVVIDGAALAVEAGVQTTDEATFAMSAGAADGAVHVRLIAPATSTKNAIAMKRAYDALIATP